LLRMAKDKYVWLVFLLVAGYVAWVAVSAHLARVTDFAFSLYDQKSAQLATLGDVDGLIFGGSNAVYSLSAERLSELSGERWYNATIQNEGVTWENQERFLDDVAESVDTDAVKTVIFASIRHVHRNLNDELFLRNIGLDEEPLPPLWLPYRSLAETIVGPNRPVFPQFTSPSGDLMHDESGMCVEPRKTARLRWAPQREVDEMLGLWLPAIRERFPSANIVITVPSQVIREVPADYDAAAREYLSLLESRVAAWESANSYPTKVAIRTILEANVNDESLVCNTDHHFNAEGRTIRTDALFATMRDAMIVRN
jgi:hypothetical protein